MSCPQCGWPYYDVIAGTLCPNCDLPKNAIVKTKEKTAMERFLGKFKLNKDKKGKSNDK